MKWPYPKKVFQFEFQELELEKYTFIACQRTPSAGNEGVFCVLKSLHDSELTRNGTANKYPCANLVLKCLGMLNALSRNFKHLSQHYTI